MNKLLKILGLMSGTSLDGLDIALVEVYESRGKLNINNPIFKSYSYDEAFRQKLITNISSDKISLKNISDLNVELADVFSEYINKFLRENGLSSDNIDLLASHGQTFFHSVDNGKAKSSLQLGDGSVIAQKTGITTISDFRNADIACGGQGAPLVPFLDKIIFAALSENIAAQNIGGIANLTYLPSDINSSPVAFDSGPGNMLLDSLIRKVSNGRQTYDHNGQMARKGKLNQKLLNHLLNHPYFSQKPPKSTGREQFGEAYSEEIYEFCQKESISSEDTMASLNYFVAKTIYDSYLNFLPELPSEIVLSGGGAYNLTLVENLKQLFGKNVRISTIDKYGIRPDAKEAVAFAVMAYCTFFGMPNNFPQATGSTKNIVMGKISPGNNYKRLIIAERNESGSENEITETNNLLSSELDLMNSLQITELMNKSDYDVINAVDMAKNEIAAVLDDIVSCISEGGKLFYIGAGTSGRLGVLDASECPPTFSTEPEQVQGIIAGGEKALTNAIEGAEDSAEGGKNDVREKGITSSDILIGISANGKAPYVISALEQAKESGAKTALLTCNQIEKKLFIDHIVKLAVGPEILSGSTRLKAGTATKMVLNIFSTGAFARTGKVFANYMVDLKASNKKLKKRAVNIICRLTELSTEEAEDILQKAEGSVKLALLMNWKNLEYQQAKKLLENNRGFLRKSLED